MELLLHGHEQAQDAESEEGGISRDGLKEIMTFAS